MLNQQLARSVRANHRQLFLSNSSRMRLSTTNNPINYSVVCNDDEFDTLKKQTGKKILVRYHFCFNQIVSMFSSFGFSLYYFCFKTLWTFLVFHCILVSTLQGTIMVESLVVSFFVLIFYDSLVNNTYRNNHHVILHQILNT